MTYPFSKLIADPDRHADLISQATAAASGGKFFDLVKTLRGDNDPARQLLLAWALGEMAATGVHIDDVHFDCHDAVAALDKSKASPAFSAFANAAEVAAYEAVLRQRLTRALQFAESQGLPLERPVRDEELALMNRLISEGARLRHTDPKAAAEKLSAALDLSRKRGAGSSYIECELALARAAAFMSDETIAAIEPIARRQVFSRNGDNGQHYGPAVWLTLHHMAQSGKPVRDISTFWENVKGLERQPERNAGIGLRDRTAVQQASFDALQRRDPKVARSIKASLDGVPPKARSWLDWFRR